MSNSSTTADEIPGLRPDQILLLEFIESTCLTLNGFARAIGVPPRRINEIVLGRRAITAASDLRLACYFGLSEGRLLTGSPVRSRPAPPLPQIATQLDRIEPRLAAA